jgi:hypothetical protein
MIASRSSRARVLPWRSLLEHRRFGAAVLLVSAAVILVDLVALVHALRGNSFWVTSTDFGLYLRTADLIRHGESAYPHVADVGAVHHAYAYPPLLAEILLPLSAIGHGFARAVWVLLSLACMAGTVALLLRGFGRRIAWHWVALAFAAVLTTYPAHNDLYHGQADVPLMFLLTVAIWCYTRGKQGTAGAVWGLTFAIKPFLGVVVVYLLWKRAYRAALSAIGSACAFVVASFAVVLPADHSAIREFVRASRYDASAPFTTQLDNFSLRGFFERAFTANPFAASFTDSSLLLALASAGLALVLIAIFVVGMRGSGTQGDGRSASQPLLTLVEIGWVYALAMTYGPLTEGSHLFYLLPAVVGVVLFLPVMIRRAGMNWSALTALSWLLLVVLFASPVNRLSGVNSVVFGSSPHGVTLLLTARVGLALLLASATTGIVLARVRMTAADARPAPVDEQVGAPAVDGAAMPVAP